MGIAIRIAAWRKARGLTQAAIARTVGVSVSAASLWEAGLANPSQRNLEKIVEALGLTMARFYGPLPKRTRKAAA